MAILRKIKDRLKSIVTAGINKKEAADTTKKNKGKDDSAKKEALGIREMAVEQTKYSHPEPARMHRPMPHDLPYGYGQNKIILQVRDPWWIHAYWEITGDTFEKLQQRLHDAFHYARRVLRVYDISQIIFDGTNAHRFFDIEVGQEANNWYIDVAGPGRSWCVDYGLRLANNGEFITIARSNTVHTPIEGPSWITDEEWMIPDDMFARLYGMGFGLGRSSPVGKAWQERLRQELFSGVLASPGITSVASPVKKIPKERKFWLVVNTELIVYGATEPDAKVTVQGKPITLRQDGTFTLRFALPDGKQVIPVKAVSSDSVEERTITPIVVKETK
jgi:hypothetical protein